LKPQLPGADYRQYLSPPTRGRGLKLELVTTSSLDRLVAPHAGAWVETRAKICCYMPPSVAPHAGAWVETMSGHGLD